MFRKKCARRRFTVVSRIRFQGTALRDAIFFFAFALIPASPCWAAAVSSAGETTAAAAPAEHAAGLPRFGKTEIAANYPFLQKPTTQLVVNIIVNGESKGDFFLDIDNGGELYLSVEDLVNLKLNIAEDGIVLIRAEKYAPLRALRDVGYTFDEKKLTVSILGKTAEKQYTAVELYSLENRPQNVYYPRETSAFFNYGLTYSYVDPVGFQSFTATSKLGARSGDVFFVSDSVYTKTPDSEHFVRLQSSATYERRGDLQWFVLGDQFANSGDLGSSVNMGGIGFSKVYKIDPYLITQPVFDLKGTAAYASQAEIYLDGTLVSKQQIAPGVFDLKNIYSYTGSHRVEVLLRDPFGNVQRISYPLYFSTQLLREGLHEYSYNLGFLRQQFGSESNDYGKPVFSAFHRYGLTSSLNIGARVEGSNGITNGGISTSFLMPRAGAVTLSLAGSSTNGTTGSAGSVQHSYQLGSLSTNLLIRVFSREYATVGTAPSPDAPKVEMSLGAAFTGSRFGGVSLSYSDTETQGGLKTRVTSGTYSLGLSKSTNLFMTASATRTVDTTYGFFVGFNFTLAKDVHGAIQYARTGDADTETVQMQKDVPIGEGLGYRASLNRSDTGASSAYSFSPFIQYNARYGTYSVDSNIQNSQGNTTGSYNISAAGSLVYAGGFYGLSRPVNDGFGIVMVDNVPNATVLNNGQEIGKTDSSGTMIVPTLASYNQNQLTLDVKNLPMDYSITDVSAKISPSSWSGSCIAFGALKVRAVTGRLYVQKDDKKIPLEFVDISMKIGERQVTFPTGKGGEFYMENTLADEPKKGVMEKQSCSAIAERRMTGGNYIQPGSYQASVDYDGETCRFNIIFPVTEDVISDIGEIQCVSPQASAPVIQDKTTATH
jgi:outer membrane usher protein